MRAYPRTTYVRGGGGCCVVVLFMLPFYLLKWILP